MDHNLFHFIAKCCTSLEEIKIEIISSYFSSNSKYDFELLEIKELIIAKTYRSLYKAELFIETKDYGVSQVGVSIIGSYIRKLYTNLKPQEYGFLIDNCMINPNTEEGKGASVRWDYQTNQLIIEEL